MPVCCSSQAEQGLVGNDAVDLVALAGDLDGRGGAGADRHRDGDEGDGGEHAAGAGLPADHESGRHAEQREAEVEDVDAGVVLVGACVVHEDAEFGEEGLLVEPRAARGGLLGGQLHGFDGAAVFGPPGLAREPSLQNARRRRGDAGREGGRGRVAQESAEPCGGRGVAEPVEGGQVDALAAVVRPTVEAGAADDGGEEPVEHPGQDWGAGVGHSHLRGRV